MLHATRRLITRRGLRAACRLHSTAATTEPHVIRSPHAPIQVNESATIPEMVRLLAGRWSDSVGYSDSVTGFKISHAEMLRAGRGFGAALLASKDLKARRGDVVGVVLPNCPQYASVLQGIWEAGLVASPINPAYTKEEVVRQLADSGSVAVVTIPPFTPLFDPTVIRSHLPALKSLIVVAEPGASLPAHAHSYAEMAKTDPKGVGLLSDGGSKVDTRETLALLPYSSGTTGLPKGVMISHFNMVNQLLQLTAPGVLQVERNTNPNAPQERVLGLLPFFHCFGFTVFCVFAPSVGGHVHTLPRFTPQDFVKAIRTHRPTILHLVPPLLAFLVGSSEVTREDLASVHTVVAGAAPFGPALLEGLRAKAGHELLLQEAYGCTELTAGATALPGRFGGKTGSCGVPFPSSELKVVGVEVGNHGVALGVGEVGEICFRGPQMMTGYWQNPKATAETLRDGWLHTGDLGYVDSDGCVFIVDRLKELIKVKGFQVAPAELEDLLRSHAGVADAAVIGVPDEGAGQLPRAYIVRKPGTAGTSLSEKEISEYVEGRVAKYKALKGGVEFVDAIPKAPSGKILRRELVRVYKERVEEKKVGS